MLILRSWIWRTRSEPLSHDSSSSVQKMGKLSMWCERIHGSCGGKEWEGQLQKWSSSVRERLKRGTCGLLQRRSGELGRAITHRHKLHAPIERVRENVKVWFEEAVGVLQILQDVTGKALNISHEPPRTYDVQKSVLNIDEAKTQLDWEPITSLSDGIKMTYLDALKRI